jgi:hypothetical protein
VAVIAKDTYVEGALNWSLITSAPSFDIILRILRQMSFLLIATSATIASFAVFTLLGTPHPRR